MIHSLISKKLYCYVDETGQDTKGRIFIVSIIVTAEFQEEMANFINKIEVSSGKNKFKWGRSGSRQRLNFIKEILSQNKIKFRAYYSIYKNTSEYKNSTILTIAKSIHALINFKKYTFNVYVDGLSKKDEKYFGSQLHHLDIHTKKIKGVKKDENNPMIRLADSICGFIRDVIEEENKEYRIIFNEAVKKEKLVEV